MVVSDGLDELQVHCRTGSLEKLITISKRSFSVHCRTGSLEIPCRACLDCRAVHCRTGSLENRRNRNVNNNKVHCRTGSLEIILATESCGDVRSLPHRQLRKPALLDKLINVSSLPHRQLRNARRAGCGL